MEIWLLCFIKDIILIEILVDQKSQKQTFIYLSFIILLFRKWYVLSMNCFNAKLIIAPLVQMLSWKAYKHCLAPAMITNFLKHTYTAHLIHLVLEKKYWSIRRN